MNPLDAVIPVQTLGEKAEAQEEREERERVTFHLPASVIERVRNAIFWTPGLTLTEFARNAFLRELEEMEKEKGSPFPPRKREIRRGRPLR
jgi:hypothetical protein